MNMRILGIILTILVVSAIIAIKNTNTGHTLNNTIHSSRAETTSNRTIYSNIIIINIDKLVDELLENNTVQDMINKLGLRIDKYRTKVKYTGMRGENIEVIVLFTDATNTGLALRIDCIIDKYSNLIEILQITPVSEQSNKVNIYEARRIIMQRENLRKIYYNPKVHKIMNKYNISFNDFLEANKDVQLRNGSNFDLILTVLRINKDNTTEYLVYKPEMAGMIMNMTECPLTDIIEIHLAIEHGRVNVIGANILHDGPFILCFFGPMKRG